MFAIRVNKAKFNCKTLIQTFIAAFLIFFFTYTMQLTGAVEMWRK